LILVLVKKLCDEVRDFLRASQAITDEYEKTLAEIDETRGSAYHRRRTAEAEAERDEALARCRARASARLEPILNTLETRLGDAALVPPTDEQLRALQLLSLRKNVSAGELQQCAQLCADCPAAIELLREVAAERGMPLQLPAPKTLSATVAREHLLSARRSLELLIYKPQDAFWSPRFLLADSDDHMFARLCGCWADRSGQLNDDYISALKRAIDEGSD
jgi:hypothetical protein